MFTLDRLILALGASVEGNLKEVRGLAPFDYAKEGFLTFASDIKYLKRINETKASAILIPNIDTSLLPKDKTYLKVDKSPRELMPILLDYFKPKTSKMEKAIEDSSKISTTAFVSPVNTYIGHNVEIGANAYIYPNVTILEGTVIGENTIIYPNVCIREFSKIGNNVIIQPGAIIGSDGFGFVKVNDENVKIEQIGTVIIEDNVEIGANTCIDRGAIGDTIIKKGCKLDNLVHIAHNVVIGEQGLIIGQVGVAGSTTIGKNFAIGGQSGVNGHIVIGDNVSVGTRSGVTASTDSNIIISGYPAIDHKENLKAKVAFKRLPEILKRLKALEVKLK